MGLPTFSVVVNTLNRGNLLPKTLESLRWQRYAGQFEVIVVNGPSTDDTAQVIERWSGSIRAGRCEVANLSVSRNIGICMAQGDVVAFIDDDAVPEPEWLSQLAAAYERDEVGGAGGLVHDHTGFGFQYRYGVVDRFGDADLTPTGPTPHLCYPGSVRIPHLLGTNSSFRRTALVEIGGFDEEFEYYLDETDVCLRLVDAGYLIVQLPHAYVHHKFAPSNIRGVNRVPKHLYPVLKNKVYFTLRHARDYASLEDILRANAAFADAQRRNVRWAIGQGLLTEADAQAFEADVERALEVGVRRGLEGVRRGDMITPEKLARLQGDFKAFTPICGPASRTIVLVSRDFPPGHGGGIATFTKDLAEGLGAQGNVVHVVTRSPDIDRVDFEDGAWIHRRVDKQHAVPSDLVDAPVPPHIWNWSATAFEEVERIATHHGVDVVEAPIWDCEGIAFLADRRWPLVTSLQTTLHFWLESHADRVQDEGWLDTFARPILALERRLMLEADAVRSISAAIRTEIERAYGIRFDEARVVVSPLGLADRRASVVATPAQDEVVVLFVGRFEPRKGIDTLLAAIPTVLASAPEVRFRLVGDKSLPGPGGRSYEEAFLEGAAAGPVAQRVSFEGRLDEDALARAYAGCDVFVAPSRFESFGLVFLEAMREARPVIGCRAGGVPEIVDEGVTGLLVPPGDATSLASAILELVRSPALRARMGEAGRERFLATFTRDAMARSSAALYERAAAMRGREARAAATLEIGAAS